MKTTTMTNEQQLLVIDDEYDRTRASNGFSRYGAYLARRLPAVVDEDPDVLTDPIRWAAFAWATAAPPVMSPGYLTWNDPIEDIELFWDDGQLGAEIVVRTEVPARLVGWRSWERDGFGHLIEPWHADRVALGRVSLRTSLDVCLPEAPGRRGTHEQYVTAAKGTIAGAAAAVERLLLPILDALSGSCRCRLDAGRQP